jgi:hypothetical protein
VNQKDIFRDLSLLASFCFCLISAGLGQGETAQSSAPPVDCLILHQVHTFPAIIGGQPQTSKVVSYFADNSMKQEREDGNEIIVRLDEKKVYVVNNNQKSYAATTIEEFEKLIKDGLAEFSASETVSALEKSTGQKVGEGKVVRQGPGEQIAGYSTERYVVTGPVEFQLWVASTIEPPASYYEAFRVALPLNPLLEISNLSADLKTIRGVVLKRTWVLKSQGKSMETSTAVTSVERRPVARSTFEVPAGYKAEGPGAPPNDPLP